MNLERLQPSAQPFLRWAGGKRQLVPILKERLPAGLSEKIYAEPFLGAGSLFFAALPNRAVLGDANEALIRTYEFVRDNPDAVRDALRKLISQHDKPSYYKVRELYNASRASAAQAARFIYLNKACFNGIFRVNKTGKFNVPKGSKDVLTLPSHRDFELISTALTSASLTHCDYRTLISSATSEWFVYLDPPYPALNDTAYFTHYTVDRFQDADQIVLADACKTLDNKGALFLLSNADVPAIRSLYKHYSLERVPVRRFISCKGERLHVDELLIRNY